MVFDIKSTILGKILEKTAYFPPLSLSLFTNRFSLSLLQETLKNSETRQ